MDFKWEDGFTIATRLDGDSIVITANREGLLSLAENLKTLAEEEGRSHFHLDEYNSLEDGSKELIIEKAE